MIIETIIEQSLNDLPYWYRPTKEGDIPTHEWVNAYGEILKDYMVSPLKKPVRLLPYQVCKHCHAHKDSE